jgi:hypothetical protein
MTPRTPPRTAARRARGAAPSLKAGVRMGGAGAGGRRDAQGALACTEVGGPRVSGTGPEPRGAGGPPAPAAAWPGPRGAGLRSGVGPAWRPAWAVTRPHGFPVTPLWPGFAADALLFAAAAFASLRALALARRRGRCPACGYDRAGLAAGGGEEGGRRARSAGPAADAPGS